jgi:hypothetical protein
MYRRQLEGLPTTETRRNTVRTVDALWRLASLVEAAGDHAEAAEMYGRYAELLKDADPQFQPRVGQAREKAAALAGVEAAANATAVRRCWAVCCCM